METKLDDAGRVEIPAEILEALGLKAGSLFEIESDANEIVLKLAGAKTHLVRKGRLLVHTGRATGDLIGALQADREERIAKIIGIKP